MKYLLDTCVISELIKKKPAGSVLKWIGNADEEDLCLSVLTLGELKKGISRLSSESKRNALNAWFSDLKRRFDIRIIPIDEGIAEKWGYVQAGLEKKGLSMPSVSGLLAATAIVHGMAIITRNGKDMECSGVEILNPWILS